MTGHYSWEWVEAQSAETGTAWNECGGRPMPDGPCYTTQEQRQREKAYDEALNEVEHTLKGTRRDRGAEGRRPTRERAIELFAQFSATALDLHDDAIALLTDDFLPAGTRLARWARQFDSQLSMPDIIQACRNAWTACGLQPLLGEPVALTPAILGYSLLYPYSDNYLDREDVASEAKLRQSQRFRERLRGEALAAADELEAALWALVELIEGQYSRARFPDVFNCLLAIHQAQEHSIAQVRSHSNDGELLALSCAKGGTSVLADACLARGWLSGEESRFAFDWGVLLQLGDDLQDVREDLQRGSMTLFSGAAARGGRLDERVLQLLNFAECVSERMDGLAHGTATLKGLLRMSWRSLILMAVAESHALFSTEFLAEAEQFSPFRFAFLRERRKKLAGRRGLYAMLFDAMVAPVEGEAAGVLLPGARSGASFGVSLELPPA
jgi:hypothetical protein